MIRIVFASLVAGLLAHTCAPSRAADAPLDWAIDRATTPANVCLYYTAGQCLSIGTMSSSGVWSASLAGRNIYFADDFGTFHDFIGDDAAAINAAITAAVVAGGGTVAIAPKTYWAQSASVTVPKNVKLICSGYSSTVESLARNYQNYPCSIYFAPGKSLILNGESENVNVFADLVHFTSPVSPNTRAQMQTYVASFAGTGVQIGDGTGDVHADGAAFRSGLVGGFTKCIDINRASQIRLVDVLGDCTNGLFINRSFDDNRIRNVQFWEFLTTNQTHTFDSWNISAISDNGSGLIRLTFGSATDIVDNEVLWASGGGTGGEGAGGKWTLDLIDPTHVDLIGSVFAPTTTGTTTAGRSYVAVASTSNLQPGMTVADSSAGACITAGTKVGAVWRTRPAISLVNTGQTAQVNAAGTCASETLTFASTAYTPNTKTLSYDGTWRTGTGFKLADVSVGTNADGTTMEGAFPFGFATCFEFNTATGVSVVNGQCDSISKVPNQNEVQIGLKFTGTQTYANIWDGSLITAAGVNIWSDATNTAGSYANTVRGPRTASNHPWSNAIEIESGGMIIIGANDGNSHSILVDSTAQTPVFSALTYQQGLAYYSGDGASTFLATNYFGGNLESQAAKATSSNNFIAAGGAAPGLMLHDPRQPANERKLSLSTVASGTTVLRALSDDELTVFDYWRLIRTNGAVNGEFHITQSLFFVGPAPTCSSTGTGTTPSCSFGAGSNNNAGVIVMTTGTGAPAALGILTLTFGTAYTGNSPVCDMWPQDTGTAWNTRATMRMSTQSLTAPVFKWDNNAVALAVSTPYHFGYTCFGK